MENFNDNVTSRDLNPLFIQEDDASCETAGEHSLQRRPAQSDQKFPGTFVDQTMSIAQYLKEMDDLLKISEEITGINKITSQEYISTSSEDTQEDISEIQTHISFDSCGEGANVSSSMSLTSAGNKLSENMVEYEGQLLNILDMLESCVEDSNMETKPQDHTPLDSHDEYVHIPKLFKETAKTTMEPSKAMLLEAHAAVLALCDQDNTADEVYVRKKATRAITQSPCHQDNTKSVRVQYPEKSTDINNTAKVQDELQPQLEWTKSEQMCEKTITEDAEVANITDPFTETEMDITGLNFGLSDFEILGPKLDECIDEVQCLLQKQKQLQAEVMELHSYRQQEETTGVNEQGEHMDLTDTTVKELITKLKKEEDLRRDKAQSKIEDLRQERAEEERKLWSVSVERQGLHNELWRLKRKLFVVARECAQSHAALRAQQRHVELLKKEEDELQSAEVQLREDSNKLRQEHEQQLNNIQEQLHVFTSSLLKNTQEVQCRRDSCGDVEQYLQDSLKALEERYEPILVGLLKRRDTAVDACAKVKEQAQELRVQLTPLREEIQKLALQKVCLDEKLKLISFQRKEKMGQYKEIVASLEESCRELKMELRLQKTKTNEMKELKEILNQQLTTYRSAIENINGEEETT